MKRKITTIVKILMITTCILLILMFKHMGVKILSVKSNSMYPFISKFDLIVVHPTGNYIVGDVITYKNMNILLTHRIIEIDGETITTKGDNNSQADSKKPEIDQIIGKMVIRIPQGFIYAYMALCFFTAFLIGYQLKLLGLFAILEL